MSPISSQKEGAVISQFDLAFLLRGRARERAFFVTEQFVFEQGLGQGHTIDHDEGILNPPAPLMDGPGKEFLARPAFSQQQHGGIRIRRPFDQCNEGRHGRCVRHDGAIP